MKKMILLILLMGVFLTDSALATTLTFDDSSAPPVNTGYSAGSSFSYGGLTFRNNGLGYMFNWDSNSPNSNGTNGLIFSFLPSDILSITKTGGGLFDFNSADMSISWYDNNLSEQITINGAQITLIQGLQTYALNLSGVSQVDITGLPGRGYFLLDNLVYNASTVPEPSTMLLLGAGLAGLAFWRKRRS